MGSVNVRKGNIKKCISITEYANNLIYQQLTQLGRPWKQGDISRLIEEAIIKTYGKPESAHQTQTTTKTSTETETEKDNVAESCCVEQ